MKKNSLYLAAGMVVALSSCADKDEVTVPDVNGEVQFTAEISGGPSFAQAKTRFVNPGALEGLAFSAGDKITVGVMNNANGPANYSEKTGLRTLNVTSGPLFSPNAPLYWDDLGGRGTDAFVWGVYTHNKAGVTVDKTGKFNWEVTNNQTTVVDMQTLDLLYSNNKTHLKYIPNAEAPAVRDVANMVFNHAMSRILINVKAGEGFTAAEFNGATATLFNQYNKVGVSMLEADTFKVDKSAVTDVKMKVQATPKEGFTKSFDAIVAPGKTYAVGEEIASLVINNNTYVLFATEDFVNALHAMSANDDLLKGKYYTFNLVVSKMGINFSASITDWAEGYTTPADQYEKTQIVIDSEDRGDAPEGTNRPDNFYLYQSKDGENYDANSDKPNVQPSTSCTYDETTGTWKYEPAIYWQGENDQEEFRGFYPGANPSADKDNLFNDENSAPLKAGDNDYQWGTSDGKVDPTSGKVNMQFNHVMSNIIINLKTVSGSAAVTLAGAKVEITNTIQEGAIDLHTGDIKLGTERKDYTVKYEKNASGVYTYTTYAIPQTLNGADGVADNKDYETSNDAFVKITVNPGTAEQNTYYFKLNSAMESGNVIDEWEKNKSYIYNIVIKKTGIEFEAKIADWIKAYESDDITIHL